MNFLLCQASYLSMFSDLQVVSMKASILRWKVVCLALKWKSFFKWFSIVEQCDKGSGMTSVIMKAEEKKAKYGRVCLI